MFAFSLVNLHCFLQVVQLSVTHGRAATGAAEPSGNFRFFDEFRVYFLQRETSWSLSLPTVKQWKGQPQSPHTMISKTFKGNRWEQSKSVV